MGCYSLKEIKQGSELSSKIGLYQGFLGATIYLVAPLSILKLGTPLRLLIPGLPT
jgi:hypothetical protein